MLEIVSSYHCITFEGRLMTENGKKLSFGPEFGPFDPNSRH